MKKFTLSGYIAATQEAIGLLPECVNESFESACDLISEATGKLVFSGVGKSGYIARKLASSFASFGITAIFIHPTEASHGDLGILESGDVLIALSRSGNTTELDDIVDFCRQRNIKSIAITSKSASRLVSRVTVPVLIPDVDESCLFKLAPTTSTTLSLVIGDALLLESVERRNLSPIDFSIHHPGGNLGFLQKKIVDVMRTTKLPLVSKETTILDSITVMTEGRCGCVGIVADDQTLLGIFTDGDFRRHISSNSKSKFVGELMTTNPVKIETDSKVIDVVKQFESKKIPSAFICENEKPIGIIHIHDLLGGSLQ